MLVLEIITGFFAMVKQSYCPLLMPSGVVDGAKEMPAARSFDIVFGCRLNDIMARHTLPKKP